MKTYLYRASNLKTTFTLLLGFMVEVNLWHPLTTVFSCNLFIIIRECGRILYLGLQHAVPPTNTKFKLLLLPSQLGMPFTNVHKQEYHISSAHSHFWSQLSTRSPFLPPNKNQKFLLFFIINIIRECGNTFCVGLAHTAPPTNTNFRLTFLLTRLQEAL